MGNARNDARLVSDFAAWAVQQADSLKPDVIDALVDFKASYLDSPHSGRWRDGDLTELLLHVFPRKVTADDATMTILDEELSEGDATLVFTAAVDDQALRPHTVSWLLAHGRHVDLMAEDRRFAIVEALAFALDSGDDDTVQAILAEPGFDVAMIESLWRCPHAASAAVLAAVGGLHPDRTVAKAARKAAFKAQSRRADAPR